MSVSESGGEGLIKKERVSENMTKLIQEARLKGEEFVTMTVRLIEQKKTDSECK